MTSPAIVGVKFRRMPNSLKMTVTVPVLLEHNGDRKFTAGQEAGFLVVVGNQVRFGQTLEGTSLLERAQDAADALHGRRRTDSGSR